MISVVMSRDGGLFYYVMSVLNTIYIFLSILSHNHCHRVSDDHMRVVIEQNSSNYITSYALAKMYEHASWSRSEQDEQNRGAGRVRNSLPLPLTSR